MVEELGDDEIYMWMYIEGGLVVLADEDGLYVFFGNPGSEANLGA